MTAGCRPGCSRIGTASSKSFRSGEQSRIPDAVRCGEFGAGDGLVVCCLDCYSIGELVSINVRLAHRQHVGESRSNTNDATTNKEDQLWLLPKVDARAARCDTNAPVIRCLWVIVIAAIASAPAAEHITRPSACLGARLRSRAM